MKINKNSWKELAQNILLYGNIKNNLDNISYVNIDNINQIVKVSLLNPNKDLENQLNNEIKDIVSVIDEDILNFIQSLGFVNFLKKYGDNEKSTKLKIN